MSMITCLIIFSGSSALSTRSLRFARTKVETRSKSAISTSLDSRCLRITAPIRLRRFVADGPDLAQQIRHLHARKGLEQRRNLRRHFGDIAGDFVQAGGIAIPRGNNRDLV